MRRTRPISRISLESLAKLKREFDFDALDPQTQLSWRLYEADVENNAEGFRYRLLNYPVNQMYGWHTSVPTFLMNVHRVDNVADAEAYIARLNGVPAQADQVILNLQKRAALGVVAPKFAFPARARCLPQSDGRPAPSMRVRNDSALLADFTKKVTALKDVDQATRDRLLGEAKKALLDSFKPAYEKLIAFLQEQEKTATDDVGAWRFPDGRDFYEYALQRTTTTNMSADEIHALGLKEVARIHGEMEKIKGAGRSSKATCRRCSNSCGPTRRFYLPDTEAGKADSRACDQDHRHHAQPSRRVVSHQTEGRDRSAWGRWKSSARNPPAKLFINAPHAGWLTARECST